MLSFLIYSLYIREISLLTLLSTWKLWTLWPCYLSVPIYNLCIREISLQTLLSTWYQCTYTTHILLKLWCQWLGKVSQCDIYWAPHPHTHPHTHKPGPFSGCWQCCEVLVLRVALASCAALRYKPRYGHTAIHSRSIPGSDTPYQNQPIKETTIFFKHHGSFFSIMCYSYLSNWFCLISFNLMGALLYVYDGN